MRKLLVLIIIIGALGTLYFLNNSSQSENIVPGGNNGFQPDPSSATFSFDEGSVQLSNGKAEEDDNETGLTIETTLLEERAYGDLNADNKEDAVVLLAQTGGASGVFIYAAAYVSGPVNYKGSNALFIGDRVSPQSISISNGVATVRFLDRNPDEPLAAEPTVPASKQFIYRNGEFQER